MWHILQQKEDTDHSLDKSISCVQLGWGQDTVVDIRFSGGNYQSMTQLNSGQNSFIWVGKFAIRIIVVTFKNNKPDSRVHEKNDVSWLYRLRIKTWIWYMGKWRSPADNCVQCQAINYYKCFTFRKADRDWECDWANTYTTRGIRKPRIPIGYIQSSVILYWEGACCFTTPFKHYLRTFPSASTVRISSAHVTFRFFISSPVGLHLYFMRLLVLGQPITKGHQMLGDPML